jgi:hypothetical protein
VLAAIDLYNEILLDAAKVHNKITDKPLPSKLCSVDLAITHLSPKSPFRVGGCAA